MLSVEEYKRIIKPKMGERRFNHSVNVSVQALKLAKIYGADERKAAVAGILHDITKETPREEQLQIIRNGGIILDTVQRNAPKLWHSISGSVYIRNVLNITDEDIINAVRFHTTGRAGMSLLEKIIYIADYTSAERSYDGVEIMREKAEKNLDDAMIFSYQFTLKNLSEQKLAIHKDELDGYNDLVLRNLK